MEEEGEEAEEAGRGRGRRGEEAEDGGRGGGVGEDPKEGGAGAEEGGGAAEEEEAGGALIHMVSHIFIQLYDVVYTWIYPTPHTFSTRGTGVYNS